MMLNICDKDHHMLLQHYTRVSFIEVQPYQTALNKILLSVNFNSITVKVYCVLNV